MRILLRAMVDVIYDEPCAGIFSRALRKEPE